tara:strand:+ start:215 stop:361 length:147 start_codon:yes stop_codon:yes gene_type:complete
MLADGKIYEPSRRLWSAVHKREVRLLNLSITELQTKAIIAFRRQANEE